MAGVYPNVVCRGALCGERHAPRQSPRRRRLCGGPLFSRKSGRVIRALSLSTRLDAQPCRRISALRDLGDSGGREELAGSGVFHYDAQTVIALESLQDDRGIESALHQRIERLVR